MTMHLGKEPTPAKEVTKKKQKKKKIGRSSTPYHVVG